MPTIEYRQAGAVTFRETAYGPDETAISPHEATATRGNVHDLSHKSSKRIAVLTGRWLAGEREPVLFVTLTLGPRWQGHDFRRTIKLLMEWLKRHGYRGVAMIEVQQRGAPHAHLYLAGGDSPWDDLLAYWLKLTAATGSRPAGQDHRRMRSEEAAIAYAVRHHSKRSQQGGRYRGRRWRVVNPQAVEAHSAPVEPWSGLQDLPPIRAGYMNAALLARPFSQPLFLSALAGSTKAYFVGPLPIAPVPFLWHGTGRIWTRGWIPKPRPPVPTDDPARDDEAHWRHQMESEAWELEAEHALHCWEMDHAEGPCPVTRTARRGAIPVQWTTDTVTVGRTRYPLDSDSEWQCLQARRAARFLTHCVRHSTAHRMTWFPLSAELPPPPVFALSETPQEVQRQAAVSGTIPADSNLWPS